MATLWWDEQPELLDLALVLGWNATSDESTSGHQSPSVAGSQESPRTDRQRATTTVNPSSRRMADGPQRTVKVNRSRERQQQETRDLRVQVAHLSEELARLQALELRTVRAERGVVVNTSAMWQCTAKRQFHSRRKAERVNVQLRELLKAQSAQVEQLTRALQRAERIRQNAIMSIGMVACPRAMLPNTLPNDQELAHRLAKMTAEWHVPYRHYPRFSDRHRGQEFFDDPLIRQEADDEFLDFHGSSVHPVPKERMEQELWKMFTRLQVAVEDVSLESDSCGFGDEYSGSFQATSRTCGVVGVLDSRYRVRRFRNQHGEQVIALTACGKPSLVRQSRGHATNCEVVEVDALVCEDTWLRVMDGRGSSSTGQSSPLTVVQHLRHTRIRLGDEARHDRQVVEALKTFLIHVSKEAVGYGEVVSEQKCMS